MADRITEEDMELLDELGVETAPEESGGRTAREQRIIAGFEEIERFVEEHGRTPKHGEDGDIFERIYAVRLDRLRSLPECRQVLQGLDPRGLLGPFAPGDAAQADAELTDDELLESLGVDETPEDDINRLVHVRSYVEIKSAEEIARRAPCRDFDEFKPIFERLQRELQSGERRTVKYKEYADVKKGDLFILDGHKVIVADLGEPFLSEYERPDRRLRVVYDNGTESDLLLRSLQRALYKDKSSRRITEKDAGPLFSEVEEEDDLETGYVYVLRSLSDNPYVSEFRTLIHKIGVTGGDVKNRIAGAKKDPTYLLADVEIVLQYKLANINRKKLEAVLHKFFSVARLDLNLKDRFSSKVEPREWFLVPLSVIEEVIDRIKDGAIGEVRYDPKSARLVDFDSSVAG